MLAQWWSETISEDSAESEIISDFDLSKGTVVKKCQYDAFHGTQLEDELKKSAVAQLVITGVMTHLCCETTTRSAFVKGFEVFFTIDGTATASEDFHVATLLNLAHGFASPVLVEDIARSFEE
jgi:isochorismate hydrolase